MNWWEMFITSAQISPPHNLHIISGATGRKGARGLLLVWCSPPPESGSDCDILTYSSALNPHY